MEDDPAAEADHGGTLAIHILHMIDVLGCLDALLLAPLLDGLAKSGHINQSRKAAKPCHSLLNAGLVGGRTLAELGHLLERRVGHLSQHHTTRKTILDVVGLETLPQRTVRAEHRPVVGHVHHARLGLIRVVVLSPFAPVERKTIDVVLRRPRASTVRLPKRVQFLSKTKQGVAARVLETLQER